MAESTQPATYTTVAPWIVTDDTSALLDFIVAAFEGEELARAAVDDGSIGHAEIRVGDTVLLAFDRQPEWPELPCLLRVWVPDADAAMQRAVERGAQVVTAASDTAFGQRGGRVRDPFGNIWRVVTQVEDVPEELMWERLQQPKYAESMREAQMTLDEALAGRADGRSSAPRRTDDRSHE